MKPCIWSYKDILGLICDYVEPADIFNMYLLSKYHAQKMQTVFDHTLFICPSNLTTSLKRDMSIIKTLIISGSFNKEERKQLDDVYKNTQPHTFMLDANVADFPSFYTYDSFFEHMTQLTCLNGSIEFIQLDKFTHLETLTLQFDDNNESHFAAQHLSNVKRLQLKDCVCEPKGNISDYVFGGSHAPAPAEMTEALRMPHLTHLIIGNSSVKAESFNLNPTLIAQCPLWIPQIEFMDFHYDDQCNLEFGWLKKLPNLRYFRYRNRVVQMSTFPKNTTIQYLSLEADLLCVSEQCSELGIDRVELTTKKLVYNCEKMIPASQLRITAQKPPIGVVRWDGALYVKTDKWNRESENDALAMLLSAFNYK